MKFNLLRKKINILSIAMAVPLLSFTVSCSDKNNDENPTVPGGIEPIKYSVNIQADSNNSNLVNEELKFIANVKENNNSISKNLYYEWSIENEQISKNGEKQLLHTFKSSGPKRIKVNIFDNKNNKNLLCSNSLNINIVPGGAEPIKYSVNIQADSNNSNLVNEELKFIANVKENNNSISKNLYYEWSIENEQISKNGEKQLIHTFKSSGPKRIKVNIFDNKNNKNLLCSNSLTINIMDNTNNNNKEIENVSNDFVKQLENTILEFESNENIDKDIVFNKIKEKISIDNKYDFKIDKIIEIDENIKNIKLSSTVYLKSDENIKTNSIEILVKYNVQNPPVSPTMIDKILEVAIPKKTKKDHRNITAKEFYKLDDWPSFTKPTIFDYFDIDHNELEKKFGSNIMDNVSVFLHKHGEFDFLNPRTAKLYVMVSYEGESKRKVYTYNDFKVDNSVIGVLDSKPIDLIKTPQGAKSYKGYLEKFLISDIQYISENQYVSDMKDITWEQVKQNFMYQVRFYLYQMFSENFSEVNYYIINEVDQKSFSAVGEGIIKEKHDNLSYGFQFAGHGDMMRKANLKPGDKVKIQIDYLRDKKGDFQPTLYDRTSDMFPEWFDGSWWWNFSDNCDKFRDEGNPLFVKDLPRESWARPDGKIYTKVFINGSYTINEHINQFSSWNFVFRRKIPERY